MIVNRTHATVRGRVIAAYPINNTAGGDAVLNFRVAANERQFDSATNTWHDKDTFYVTVSCWDSLARRAAAIALRGQMVVAMGTLVSRNYEKEGQRRSYTELRAQHLAVDIGSVESVRPLAEPKAEGSATGEPDNSSDTAASTATSTDSVVPSAATTATATPTSASSPMTSDVASPRASAAADTAATSPRPAYSAVSPNAATDPDQDAAPF